MRRVLPIVLVALVAAPLAFAAYTGPEPYPHQPPPPLWQQRRAVTAAIGLRQPVFCGGDRSNAVALTFDDGPGPYTEQVLSILRAAHAHATFFLVGNRMQYWPQLPRAEEQLGAVGDHTWSHPDLTALPRWLAWLELARSQQSIAAETGTMPRLFRAPYERHDAATDAAGRSLGMLQVLWSVDSGDSTVHPTVRAVERNVISGLRPGAIVLMHDIHPWTLRALPTIMRAVAARGLQAVSVPELLALDPPAANQHCVFAGSSGGG